MMLAASPRRALFVAYTMALALAACGGPVTKGDGGSPVPDAGNLDSGPPPDAGNACLTTTCQLNASCTNVDGTAVCTCNASQGFIPDISHPGVCVQNPCAGNPCGPTAFCTDEGSGTHECTCDSDAGLLGNCTQSDAGLDVCTCVGDNCAQPDGGHLGSCALNMVCATTPVGVTCSCSPGFIDAGSMGCENDWCANPAACQTNSTCANSVIGPVCTCLAGYDPVTVPVPRDGGEIDGGEVDGGEIDGGDAGSHTDAGAADAGAHDAGFVDGGSATDAGVVDNGDAGPDAGAQTMVVCQLHDYCADTPDTYCDSHATCSYDPVNGTVCTCDVDAGFTGSGLNGMCISHFPQCQQGSCPQNANCTNHSGAAFTCACQMGFDTTDAGTCIGHNFCADTDAGAYCDSSATCHYDGGSWCTCGNGLNGTGLASADVACYPQLAGSVTVGAETACALTADGGLYCWGGNDQGQFANGTSACLSGTGEQYGMSCPTEVGATEVPAGSSWVDVAVGSNQVCGIQAALGATSGTLWCWGRNDYGQLGYAISGFCTGSMSQVSMTANGAAPRWVRVKAGELDTCALDVNSYLWCWGDDSHGQLGNGSTAPEATSDAGAGPGGGVLPQLIQVNGETPTWIDFAVGAYHICGVQTDGSLWCWGRNDQGELGNGPAPGGGPMPDSWVPILIDNSPPGWASVAAGGDITAMSCGIKTDGTLWCWGNDNTAGLGVTPGQSFDGGSSCVAPESTFGVVVFASPSCVGFGPSWNGASWSAVSIGPRTGTVCALMQSPDGLNVPGTVWCSGADAFGQCGVSPPLNDTVAGPLEVEFGEGGEVAPKFPMVSISSGFEFACSLDSASQVWCWGHDDFGQLGDCETVGNSSPTPIPVK